MTITIVDAITAAKANAKNYPYPVPTTNHNGYIGFDGTSPGTTTQLQISWSDANGGYIGAWLNSLSMLL